MYFLKTNRLSLVNWGRAGFPDRPTMGAYLDVRLLGALTVRRWHIESNGPTAPEDDWWGQNPAMSPEKIGDTPIRREASGATGLELEEEVAWGVMQAVLDNASAIRDFLEGRQEACPDILDFAPPRWEGRTLAIPVDYACFYCFQSGIGENSETVTATLCLGYHVLCHGVTVSRRGDICCELPLEDAELQSALLRSLSNDPRALGVTCSGKAISDMKTELFYPFDGYVEGVPPPSVCYEG